MKEARSRKEHSVGDGCPYSWLNEWLCEYVDGTMDPSLQRVFEEYVQANPELKAHVERLRRTRELLCRCSRASGQGASDAVRARVQEKVECDMLRTPGTLHEAVREHPVTAFASTLVVALVVGVFAGATLFAPEPVSTRSARAVEAAEFDKRPPVSKRASLQEALVHDEGLIASPLAPNSTTFYTMMEYEATGMPYVPTLDSASSAMTWHAGVARP